MKRRFIQCDVFSETPAKGNGLAVVLDSDGLSTEDMLAFAAWTNLAETTFLLPPNTPEADYQVRIFTPNKEMLFAGHPTLGSCMSWLHAGGQPRDASMVRQECAVGIVDIDISGPHPAFAAPDTHIASMPAAARGLRQAAMGLTDAEIKSAVHLQNGPEWFLFELQTADQVLKIDSSKTSWPTHAGTTLIGAYPAGSPCDYEVRNIAPSSGMSEDPITGSLNAAIAKWLAHENRLTEEALIAQGTKIGRLGRVSFRRDQQEPSKIWIGGAVNILIEGMVEL